MIEYSANILVKIMQNISSKDIIEESVTCDAISLGRIKEICFAVDGNLDETAIDRKLHYLREWIKNELEIQEDDQHDTISLFELVHCLRMRILSRSQGKRVYRYKYLKTWHYLEGKIGTDLLILNAYAYDDYKKGLRRKTFADIRVMHHDNYMLNEILDRGLSENHFHLLGSLPYFVLSWCSLMNSVTSVQIVKSLDKLNKKPRNPRMQIGCGAQEDRFMILHLKAAAIRVYMYAFLTGQMIELSDYYVSVEWLLRYLVRTEPIGRFFHDVIIRNENVTLKNFLEKHLRHKECLLTRFQKCCPGFYWLFWEIFPHIPMNGLERLTDFLCTETVSILSKQIEEYGEPLLLRKCAWLFRDRDPDYFQKEWYRQTIQTLDRLLKEPESYGLQKERGRIQRIIDGFHIRSDVGRKDYMVSEIETWNAGNWEEVVVSGEYWLYYTIMYHRFYHSKDHTGEWEKLYNLFYVYLVIKESFRMELLQNNEKIGFENFEAYQKRKGWFSTQFSKGELARIAVKEAFKHQNLLSLELRISPTDSSDKNIWMIREYDRNIDLEGKWGQEQNWPYYYVFHFHKKRDDEVSKETGLRFRHEKFREDLKRRANAILFMREKNPEIAKRLLGIDACASEDGCRPEVFAVAFRVLKNHMVYGLHPWEKVPQLRVSYHVGEENQDVLDGLRAIDEAVYFLNMESGDRLGHATMMGIDVMEWYSRNNFTVSIRQQDYLDNVAWLYHKIIDYHLPNKDNLLEYLENEFQTFFSRIYKINLDNGGRMEKVVSSFDIHTYYHSWELRGDRPDLYVEGHYKRELKEYIWDDQAINPKVSKEKRRLLEAALLYHEYHYDEDVRKEGNKPVIVKIPYHMVRGIELVQKKMQHGIVKRGIAIETNPSSNLRIAGLSGYEHHPILSFYNKGLVGDMEQMTECPQINVSVNTDDLGVFTTFLHNEYTLMAWALEEMKTSDGMNVYKKDRIYEWLNCIREMGNSQAFSKELKGEWEFYCENP